VATTRSRPRGRESARPSSGGVATEHASKIYGVAIGGTIVIIAFLALTSAGHVIDAAAQRFMLYYAGVFTLIALCGSVGLGLVATDRMILNPGHRIFVQSAHRAASFGALTFLVIHIVTEILAQRVHALDAFVPFLSPFRTFYIGLGTIASDLILLLVITGIMRKRFTANSKAWRWRAIHYTSYLAFILGVWHGLVGGRPGKPYVDWSYGFVVAIVALGLAVRILANSLRPKENLSSPPVAESVSSGSAPLRAASMFAQLGVVRAASQSALAARSGPQPMLSAPVGGWDADPVSGPMRALTALPAGPAQYGDAQYPALYGDAQYGGAQYTDVQYGNADGRQPLYEPGYEGPPRYLGAPRNSGPMPRATTGPMPRATSGPMPRATTGPMPRATSGPMPRATTGPMPRATSGPMPRANTGPMPRADGSARIPDPSQPGNGAAPARRTGPMPRAASGPMPRAATGPMPRAATGPMPAAPPRYLPGPGGGSAPRAGSGPMPRAGGGPAPRAATGPMPRAATGPMPRPGASMPPPGGPRPGGPRPGGPGGAPSRGGQPDGRGVRGPAHLGAAGWDGSADWGDPGGDAGNWNYGLPPWDGGAPEPDPWLRYREPGPGMPGYRGYRGGGYQ
jgi:DMSO/TMAO reductase YedYZ heme-binding membrane subunit